MDNFIICRENGWKITVSDSQVCVIDVDSGASSIMIKDHIENYFLGTDSKLVYLHLSNNGLHFSAGDNVIAYRKGNRVFSTNLEHNDKLEIGRLLLSVRIRAPSELEFDTVKVAPEELEDLQEMESIPFDDARHEDEVIGEPIQYVVSITDLAEEEWILDSFSGADTLPQVDDPAATTFDEEDWFAYGDEVCERHLHSNSALIGLFYVTVASLIAVMLAWFWPFLPNPHPSPQYPVPTQASPVLAPSPSQYIRVDNWHELNELRQFYSVDRDGDGPYLWEFTRVTRMRHGNSYWLAHPDGSLVRLECLADDPSLAPEDCPIGRRYRVLNP